MPTIGLDRRVALVLALAYAAACHDGGDPGGPSSESAPDFRVLGGIAVCDACAELSFDVAGPDLRRVQRAAFLSPTGLPLPVEVTLHRFTGDSGSVLRASARFTGVVAPGAYALRLSLAPTDNAPQLVLIAGALQVTRASGTVAPPAAPPPPPAPPREPPPEPQPSTYGILAVTVEVTGTEAPDTFVIETTGGWSYADDGVRRTIVGLRGAWTVSTGTHAVRLVQLPNHCVGLDASAIDALVIAEARTVVVVRVRCDARAYVRLDVAVTGEPPAGEFTVRCELVDCGLLSFVDDGAVVLQPPSGPQLLRFHVPANCRPSMPNPLPVTAIAGQTIDVDIGFACYPPFGTVRYLVRGPAGSEPYQLVAGYDGCRDQYDCDDHFVLPAGTAVERELRMGPSEVWVIAGVPAGCALSPSSPARFDLRGGTLHEVTFDVTCP